MAYTSSQTSYATPEPTIKLRRLVIYFLIATLLFVGLVQLFSYLTKGRLTVVTNGNNSISVIKSVDGENTKEKVSSLTLHSGKSISLSPGEYIITVSSDSGASSQLTEIKARSSEKLIINVSVGVSPEPVANVNARYFGVNSSQLVYVDQITDHMYKIDDSNKLSLTNGLAFANAYWLDPSYGVAVDKAGTFYSLSGSQVTPLGLPIATTADTIFTIAANKQIYITDGHDVFSGTADGFFTKIYSSQAIVTGIVASPDKLALITRLDNGSSSGTAVSVLSASGALISTDKIDTYSAGWSPTGKYLAITADSGSHIYDGSLKEVVTLPGNNLSHPLWLDDGTLLYVINNQLWRYSLSTHSARVIANAPAGQALVNLLLTPDNSYIYISAQSTAGSNNDLSIYRFGLKDQPVAVFVTGLGAHLPWLQGGCLLSLTNLTAPTIQIYGSTPADDCVGVAKNYVSQLGFDPSKLNYQETTVPPNVPGTLGQ